MTYWGRFKTTDPYINFATHRTYYNRICSLQNCRCSVFMFNFVFLCHSCLFILLILFYQRPLTVSSSAFSCTTDLRTIYYQPSVRLRRSPIHQYSYIRTTQSQSWFRFVILVTFWYVCYVWCNAEVQSLPVIYFCCLLMTLPVLLDVIHYFLPMSLKYTVDTIFFTL